MEDINGNIIKEAQELGTRKYNLMINKRYLVEFKENDRKRSTGKGSYSNGEFGALNALPIQDIIITSLNKKDAMIIDGRINLKSIMNKILSDLGYKFYNIEIIEIGD
jgi:hypothetical protein